MIYFIFYFFKYPGLLNNVNFIIKTEKMSDTLADVLNACSLEDKHKPTVFRAYITRHVDGCYDSYSEEIHVGIYRNRNISQILFHVFREIFVYQESGNGELLINDILALDLDLPKHHKLRQLLRQHPDFGRESIYIREFGYHYIDILQEYYTIIDDYEEMTKYYFSLDEYTYEIVEEKLQ